jgi:hypothetical protein
MTVDRASAFIDELIERWEEWSAEAEQAAQIAQCDEAWRVFMQSKIGICLSGYDELTPPKYIAFSGD